MTTSPRAPFGDTAPPARTVGASPKAVAAGLGGTVLAILLVIANLSADQSLMGALPGWLQSVILIVACIGLPVVGAVVAGPGTVVRERPTGTVTTDPYAPGDA
jgi:hypothetical protein